MKNTALDILLYAASEVDADAYYLGGVFVPDAFIAMRCRGVTIAVANALEYSRIQREGRFDEVLALEDWKPAADKEFGLELGYPAGVMALLARRAKVKKFTIPANFPAGVAFDLQKTGLQLTIAKGSLFAQREIKSDQEAQWIAEGNAASAAGFRVVEKILRATEIRRGKLYWNKRPLTSEILREQINIACLQKGAIASGTIVAGGDQACDPHCRGSGPLRANELIIVDIFPRVSHSGYHGDMTRTYLKGKASEAQKALVKTVYDAQQWAISEHRSGKSGKKIFTEVKQRFDQAGYTTRKDGDQFVGFFHGLGHGLGLEVHEGPRVNANGQRLCNGQVITVEPGLYYPGLGGCRIEDVVRIQGKTPEMLSRHAYQWKM